MPDLPGFLDTSGELFHLQFCLLGFFEREFPLLVQRQQFLELAQFRFRVGISFCVISFTGGQRFFDSTSFCAGVIQLAAQGGHFRIRSPPIVTRSPFEHPFEHERNSAQHGADKQEDTTIRFADGAEHSGGSRHDAQGKERAECNDDGPGQEL